MRRTGTAHTLSSGVAEIWLHETAVHESGYGDFVLMNVVVGSDGVSLRRDDTRAMLERELVWRPSKMLAEVLDCADICFLGQWPCVAPALIFAGTSNTPVC